MKLNFPKQMSKARKMVVLAALLAPVAATAAPPAPTFGLSVARTKIGDSFGDTLYGGGQHGLARVGSQLYVTYTVPEGPGIVAVRLGRSLDGGLTWLSSPVVVRNTFISAYWAPISEYGAPLAIGPDPAGAGYYRVHVIYSYWDQVNPSSIYYTYATLNSATGSLGAFSSPVAISGQACAGSGEIGIAADGTGGVHVAYVGTADGCSGTASGILYSHSTDYGASFAEAGVLVAPNGRFPALAADAAGDVFLAYAMNTSSGAYVARRPAGAPAFGAPVLATSTGGAEVSIACADGNRVYLAWVYDSQVMQTTYHLASSTNGGATWSIANGPPVGNCLFAPSVALGATGGIGIAWTDYCTSQGGFVRSTDGGSSWSTPAVISSAYEVGGLLFDDAGKASIAFVGAGWAGEAVYFTKEK